MRWITELSCFWSNLETTVSTMKIGCYRRLLEKHRSECKPQEMHLPHHRIDILKILLHICPFCSCDWGVITIHIDIPISSNTASSGSNVSEDVTKQFMDFTDRVPGRFCVVQTKAQPSLLWGTHGIPTKAISGMPPTCTQTHMPPTCSVSKYSLVPWSSSYRCVKLSLLSLSPAGSRAGDNHRTPFQLTTSCWPDAGTC